MKTKKKKLCDQINSTNNKSMIYVEGNIAVGKSDFLHFLHQQLGIHVFYEPNGLWQDIDGHDLLGEFFKDPKRWAYTCQSYILMTRIDQIANADTSLCDKVCLVERSPYSGRYFFAQVAHEMGTMNDLEWALFKKLWKREIARLSSLPAGFIYLRTSAQVSYQRIMKRGRKEENPVTMEYLQRLEQKHENWFIKRLGVPEELAYLPVLELDFSGDIEHNPVMQKQYKGLVLDFIEKIQKNEHRK